MDAVEEALAALCISIPDWNARLDFLNGQIAQRQIELARFSNDRPPTNRSMRNKGSTESLRPRDGNEPRPGDINLIHMKDEKYVGTGTGTEASPEAGRVRAEDVTSPPSPRADSNPRASPYALARQSSQPTPPAPRLEYPAQLRKQKTESLVSMESLVPKYRTRSMIIVYYDSTVQTAFAELVGFVSSSRNTMRKGNVAAKMAAMRRIAEMEVEGDNSGNASHYRPFISRAASGRGPLLGAYPGDGTSPSMAGVPKPRFSAAMQGGNNNPDEVGGGFSLGILSGYRRAEAGVPGIFEDIDKGLEWCQSRCEYSAHQFLREGECSAEIESIKKRLLEVQAMGEKELARLKDVKEGKGNAGGSGSGIGKKREAPPGEGVYRQQKPITIRKELVPNLAFNDAAMEVDDNESMEEPPKIVFKRSRDIGS